MAETEHRTATIDPTAGRTRTSAGPVPRLTYKDAAPPSRLAHSQAVGSPALPPRTKRFVITTDALDRDQEVVLPDGGEFDEYLRNPVFLWSHRFDLPPVGKCVRIGVAPGGRLVVGDFEFATTKFAQELFDLYDGGFLNAVSVGFRTLQAGPPDYAMSAARPELARCKRVIHRWQLYEVSAVPIPSNPEALQQARTKGLSVPPEVDEAPPVVIRTAHDVAAEAVSILKAAGVPDRVQTRLDAVVANVIERHLGHTPSRPTEVRFSARWPSNPSASPNRGCGR